MLEKEIDKPERPLRIGVLLLDQFSLLPLGALLDTFRHAADRDDRSRQRHCRWQLLSHDGAPVRASCGAVMGVDRAAGAMDAEVDYLVVHGGRLAGLAPRRDRRALAALDGCGQWVGLDSGSFALAAAGLMDGYRASVHWRHLGDYRRRFPRSPAVADWPVLFDRDRCTCPGGAAAVELAVALLVRHLGRGRATKGLPDLHVEAPRQRLRSAVSAALDPRLVRATALIQARLARPPSAAALARAVGLSARQLDRLFQRQHGMSARQWGLLCRLQHARDAIEHSELPLALVAEQAGFCDLAHLSRHCRSHFRSTPAVLRRRARAGGAVA